MEVILFYIYIAICTFVAYRNRRTTEAGVITTKSGNKYGYVVGNYLKSENSTFNGLDILLPFTLTNFYLDSHKDSKRRGPAALYDRKQMIALEGDFNNYFQLFAPKGTSIFVLSVLSPDVMQTLISSSQRYDVELAGDHLRIIILEKTSKLRAGPMLAAAQAIIAELEHRSKSWQQSDMVSAKLLYRHGSTLKLLGMYIRRSRLITAVAMVLLTVVLYGLGLVFYYSQQDANFSDPYSKGILAGTIMYAAAGIVIIAIPITMLAPILWFLATRSDKDVFPTSK